MIRGGALAVALATLTISAFAADNPFAAFKGKMKPGMYETQIEVDMSQVPGMPPGEGRKVATQQHCVTPEQIERGGISRGRPADDEKCKVRGFMMSGDVASYSMACPDITADVQMTFAAGGYRMAMKSTLEKDGKKVEVTQRMQGRYLGPCN